MTHCWWLLHRRGKFVIDSQKDEQHFSSLVIMVSALHGSLPLVGSLTTHIPALVYGTAWKKERTAHLVFQAILSGFRAFDTAAQPKHYREDLVGDAVRKAIKGGIVKRHELYVCSIYLDFSKSGHPKS